MFDFIKKPFLAIYNFFYRYVFNLDFWYGDGVKFVENLQYLVLALTVAGQVVIGVSFLWGQGVWCLANFITVARDFALQRPRADIVKDTAMLGLTIGLITAYFLGIL